MNIPKQVKLGGQRIEVQMVDDIQVDGVPLSGLIDLEAGTIQLCKGQSADVLNIAFLHELIHALHAHIGLNPKPDGKLGEQYVEAMANALYGVIQDNPETFMPEK